MDPHDWMLRNLQRQIDQHAGKRLLVVTHYIPFTECIAPRYAGSPTNRYFAVPSIGQLLRSQSDGEIAGAIYGHTHVRQQIEVGGIPTFCCPLGYHEEWQGDDPIREVLRTVRVLQLTEGELLAEPPVVG